jgi:hypothetical protein
MQFTIRKVGNSTSRYADVVVTEGSTKIELGLLNAAERRALADELQSAIDDLLSGLPDDEQSAAESVLHSLGFPELHKA